MKFIDLCCGIGGFHQALTNMGMKCVLASDIDEECIKNYELNYKIKPEGDLTKIDIQKIPRILIYYVLDFHVNHFQKQDNKMVLMIIEEIYSLIYVK